MEFLHPEYLLFLILAVGLAVWTLIKPGAAINTPVAEDALAPQHVTNILMKAGLLLPSLLLAGFIILLARPITETQVVNRQPVRATNIEVLLNASRSMLAEDEVGEHCRYCASKKAIAEFVAKRSGNTMGISIFGARHLSLVPLTADLQAIVTSIAETYPDYIALQIAHSKDFEEGINRSIDKLADKAQPDSEQILILVTDGETRDLARHEEAIKKRLAENRITLYVAMIAEQNSGRILARLAESTPGGQLFECRDSKGFQEVMRHIDQMNKIEYEMASPRIVDNNHGILIWMTGLSGMLALFLGSPFRPMPW